MKSERTLTDNTFSKLINEQDILEAKTFLIAKRKINNLFNNTWLTVNYYNRFSGILIIDSKYIKKVIIKIPLIYGIDYLKHYFPVDILSPSEKDLNHSKTLKYF
jgi:hypothetical protein